MATVSVRRRVTIVSAHEGAITWSRMCRVLGSLGPYEIRTLCSYEDATYRGARSFGARVRLRLKTFVLFPIRFALRAHALARESDVLVIVTSPFFLPVIAALFFGRKRVVRIALMNDIYPEALVVRGILRRGGAIERRMTAAFHWALARMDAVVFISEHHRQLLATGPELRAKSHLIPVSAHSEPFAADEPAARDGVIEITYCGTLGLMHETQTFLRWLESGARHPAMRFSFHTSGAAKERFESQCQAVLRRRTSAVPVSLGNALDEDAWIVVMKAAAVGLVFQDVGSGNVIFPSKLAGILAAGQAVLAVADADSDVARLITEHDCGWVVHPGDVEGFERCIREIADGPTLLRRRQNAFTLGQQRFGTTAIARRWITLLDSLTAQADRGRVQPP